jgi:hypothetical protein
MEDVYICDYVFELALHDGQEGVPERLDVCFRVFEKELLMKNIGVRVPGFTVKIIDKLITKLGCKVFKEDTLKTSI